MLPRPRALTTLLLLLTLASGTDARSAAPWTYDDSIALRKVHDPRVSPDGARVVYVVSELTADGSRYQTDLWLGTIATGEQRRLTSTPFNEDVPRWSSDGLAIAFLSDRESPGAGNGWVQVWSLALTGGEATALTASPTGVSSYEWYPGGDAIAYLAPEGATDAGRARAAAGDDAWVASEHPGHARIHRLELPGRVSTPLTPAGRFVTSFTVAPDGSRIVYAAQEEAGANGLFGSDLFSIAAAGGAPSPFVVRPGMDDRPHFSPDGQWVAFLSNDGDGAGWAHDVHVCVAPASGGAPRNITPNFADIVCGTNADTDPAWDADSRSLLFVSSLRTSVHLFRAFLEPRAVEPFTQDDGVNDWPSSGGSTGALAWTHEDATHPGEVWVRDSARGRPRRFTDLNPWTRERTAFPARVVRWPGAGGREVEGLLYLPPNARPGARAPLLVYLHGGPAANHAQYFTPALDLMGRVEFLQEGWAVLLPNPRGSSGYGSAWRLASTRDWANGPYEDIVRGVDALIEQGVADSTRLAVCGWSYGGFMTANIVGRTNRFRAAVAGAGPMNLSSMPGGSDVPDFTRFSMGAWPWDDPALYRDQSPLMRAAAVRTPTAFAHGGNDVRVSITQSHEMYRALRVIGVPTDLMTLPREMHIPAEPRHFRALMSWSHDWIVRWTSSPWLPR